ncbi:transposase [Rhodococcus hoagii]|uniref:transposase n=1 Tax=Rhodococcus hoagii TaxID=43767 RepID=UPI00196696D8|nr:transposase [Prescottella equi]MBM9835482.1 transposase [Prescottella equi]
MARSRRTKIPVEVKMRVLLAVLSWEMSGAEAARRHGVSDMSVSKWKQQFLEAGRQRLEEPAGPPTLRHGR